MYTFEDYARMAADPPRTEAYLRALEATIRKGDVVLEIGTGIGLFAIAAAKLGARRVYAVELNDAVLFGAELARKAGVADVIEFHHGSVWDLAPKEKADVVFFDLRGSSPLYGDALRTAAAMIERWLRPGGVFFPGSDTLRGALVEAPFVHQKIDRLAAAGERFGVGSEELRPVLTSTLTSDSAQTPVLPEHVLTDTFTWAEVKYGEPPPTRVRAELEVASLRTGVANGIALWFDATLLPGIGYDSAPGSRGVYARIILPLERPTELAAGDRVSVALTAFTSGGEWAWDVTVRGADGSSRSATRQSTFLGRPFSVDALARTTPTSRPSLSSGGKRFCELLSAMDGTRTLAELATTLTPSPRSENDLAHTLAELQQLALRYGA